MVKYMTNDYEKGMERGLDLAIELLDMPDKKIREIFDEPDAICVLEVYTGKEIINRLKNNKSKDF